MSDLSTYAGQAEHYAAVRARLTNVAAPIPRAPRPTRRMHLLPKVRVDVPVAFGAPINLLAPAAALTIIRLVALRSGVPVDDIVGPRKTNAIVAARYDAIRLVKSHCTHLSYPGIGRIFNRDHTSILFALGKVKKQPSVNPPNVVVPAIFHNAQEGGLHARSSEENRSKQRTI